METHLDMGGNYIYNVKTPINNDQAANKRYVDGNFVTKDSATFSSDVDINNNKIANLGDPTSSKDEVNKQYTDSTIVSSLNQFSSNFNLIKMIISS